MTDLSKVTRIEVIDSTGRIFVRWINEVIFVLQDTDRTLKVYIK